MLKTPYKSLYRVHNVDEAKSFDIGKNPTDMMLYFTDLYDVILSVRSNEIPKPSLDDILDLRLKCTDYLTLHYHEMLKPIPGVLLGWSTSMLLFIIILNLIVLQYEGGDLYLDEETQAYIKKKRLRVYTDPDPNTWCLGTYVSILDVISFQWKTLTPCDDLRKLLEVCWRVCAKLTLNMHSKIVLNVESYVEGIKNMPDHGRLSEKAMVMSMAKFYWFNSTISYFQRWRKAPQQLAVPNVEDTNWDSFIKSEKRHWVTRRFRDSILNFLWDKILLYGQKEVASHSQLGEDVTSMTCLYSQSPAGYLNKLQKLITYDEYEQVIEYEPIKHWVHLVMINQHFLNQFNVKFLQFFFISEEKMYKHAKAVERSTVPLILYRFNGFEVFFGGKVYSHPQSRSIENTFVLWCFIIRTKCASKAFSMDFSPVCEKLLDRAVEIDNSRPMEGMYELEDD
jgi:hypothetical protein